MKKVMILCAAVLFSQAVAAETYQEAFNKARAMYGKGHEFQWQGKTYKTLHEEEIEADVDATEANAKALLDKAIAANKKVADVGFEWKLTGGLLKKSAQAIEAGDYRKALDLAAQAKYHARIGLAQYEYAEANWYKAVPQ
ncbi:hypothetical protein [Aliamphritea spongicola]|uniref:hypothetical protein n=1 Tax=Aliamphritea spongicola TaxID=707589 RepID=UPI00196B90AF|nr:hypothetical protein [Aliamphritea spongicola]MBN3564775.1 hypothetical protein [Aliamphritea spongicola]